MAFVHHGRKVSSRRWLIAVAIYAFVVRPRLMLVRPRWIERLAIDCLYVPIVWPMQARMLAVLKRNIERSLGTG
jgi:hypothetical protein